MHIKKLLTTALVIMTAGCAAVGPDYTMPDASAPPAWYTKLDNPVRAEAGNPELMKDWWKSFDDETLNTIIDKAAENNTDLKSARYALSAARAKIKMTQAGNLPAFEATGSATGIHYGDTSLPDQNIDRYAAGFDASWEIDIFGGLKRETEAVTADMQAAGESLRDTLVSLLAEAATAYINVRTYQSSIITAEEDIRLKTELYDLADKRYQSGLADASDVKQAKYQLEYTRTKLNSLRMQLSSAYNRISVLTGEQPGAVNDMLEKAGSIPAVPVQVATGIPADVIRRRPDVRMSERKLAAQTARIGAAKSDLYPKFTLSGSIGYQSENTGSLFDSKNSTMTIGPSFRWALFDLGTVRQNINVQTETQKKYMADYESAILTAFEDAENAMNSFDEEYRKSLQLKKAADAAEEAYRLEYSKYTAGLGDYSDVITAESAYISYKEYLAQSRGDADIYLISLYKALGGGWEAYEGKNEK